MLLLSYIIIIILKIIFIGFHNTQLWQVRVTILDLFEAEIRLRAGIQAKLLHFGTAMVDLTVVLIKCCGKKIKFQSFSFYY